MPGIALKYWAFKQTGWGEVVPEPPILPVEARSDYQDWKWIGVPQPLNDLEPFKKPIIHVEPRILTLLQFYTYTTAKYELNLRTQERLSFTTSSYGAIHCEHYSSSFTNRRLLDYLSETISVPIQHTNSSLFSYDNIPTIGYDYQENLVLQWKTGQYPEANSHINLPLSVEVNLRERHEYKTKSTISLPWYIRTPILEYVRWHMPLTISLPDEMDDETLLAALAHIIIDLEENGN